MKWKGAGGSEPDHSVEETTETEMMKEVKVDGITITGMSKNQARNAILKEYPWNMTVYRRKGSDAFRVQEQARRTRYSYC